MTPNDIITLKHLLDMIEVSVYHWIASITGACIIYCNACLTVW